MHAGFNRNAAQSDATMAAPVLVRAYTSDRASSLRPNGARGIGEQALPPISSYAFASILRSADGPDFQSAIDGIAEICAKNRMSLADEYASHLPPLGEITAATSEAVRPHLLRPGQRRALTSVPEASSGSSEGSHHKSTKRRSGLFGFRRQQHEQTQSLREMRIGSMGRTISIAATTAFAGSVKVPQGNEPATLEATRGEHHGAGRQQRPQAPARRPSEAAASLQRLLARGQGT